MPNPSYDYMQHVLANLPSDITFNVNGKDGWFSINGMKFPTYIEAIWYRTYLINNGYTPEENSYSKLSGTTMPDVPQSQPAQLVVDSEFDNPAAWNTITGLTIENGRAVIASSGATQQVMQSLLSRPLVLGQETGIIVSMPVRTAGQLSVGVGVPNNVNSSGTITAARVKSGRLTNTGPSAQVRLTVGGNSTLEIDYARVYDISELLTKKWRIVPVYSQSNWVGNEAAPASPANIYTPEPRALYVPSVTNAVFGADRINVTGPGGTTITVGRPMPALDPMQHQTANTGGGPGTAFCKAFCDGLRDDEVLIYIATGYAGGARGAGGVWNRQEGGVAWTTFENTVDYYLSIAPEGSSIAGLIFCQGESDRSVDPNPHTQLIHDDIVYLRSKPAWGDFPVVIAEIGAVVEGNTALMIESQKKLDKDSGDPLSLPHCKYVARPADAVLAADLVHFVQATCETRGYDVARAMLNLNYGT